MAAACLAITVALHLASAGSFSVTPESESALRFRGTRLLYGERGLERLRASHVAVVGLGGIGSWAAEALARTGVGTITLADLDDVCVSNANRQVHGLASLVGQPKTEVIAARLKDINPDVDVHQVMDWVTPESARSFITACEPPLDALIDAVGLVADKAGMIDACVRERVLVVTAGAPGAKSDATAIRACDLSRAAAAQPVVDPTLAEVVELLRSEYGWPALSPPVDSPHGALDGSMDLDEATGEYGVTAITSIEPPAPGAPLDPAESFRGDTLGTAVHVTGAFGFAAAGLVAGAIADQHAEHNQHWRPYDKLSHVLPVTPPQTE